MSDPGQVLRDAIARRSGIVLSMPIGEKLVHHKSRFLEEIAEGVLLETPANQEEAIEKLIEIRQPVGVLFRHSGGKASFASTLIRRDMAGLLLATPAELKIIQLRAHYRARTASDAGLIVRIWHIDNGARLEDRPLPSKELAVKTRDLSAGGIGVRLEAKNGKLPEIAIDDRMRIVLEFEGRELLLEGRARRVPASSDPANAIVGIQFTKSPDDRTEKLNAAQLNLIVGTCQRIEASRIRQGWTDFD